MSFKKALLCTVACIVGVLFVIPRTRVAQDLVRKHFLAWYERSLGCFVSCNKLSFSLLQPTIELSGASLLSRDDVLPWDCTCKRVTLRASWISFIMQGRFNLSIALDNPIICSDAEDNHISFVENHIQRYFAGPPSLPIVVKELELRQVNLHVQEKEALLDLRTLFSCTYKKMSDRHSFNLLCEEGSLSYGSAVLVHACSGHWQTVFKSADEASSLTGQGQGEITLFENNHAELCYWEARLLKGVIAGKVWRPESDDSCTMTLDKGVVDLHLNVDLKRIAEHIAPTAYARGVNGTLKASYNALLEEGFEKGQSFLSVNDVSYGNHEVFKELLFSMPRGRDALYRGTVSLKAAEKETLSGDWSWEPKAKKGEARLVNGSSVELGSFSLKPKKGVEGAYSAYALFRLPGNGPDKEGELLIKADAQYEKGDLSLHAEHNKEQFFIKGSISDTFNVSLLRWIDSDQKKLIDLSYGSAEKHRIKGMVDVGAAQRFAKYFWGLSLYGEGVVEVSGQYLNKRYELGLQGSKMAVRLPRIYNVINGFVGTFAFDPQKSTLDLTDVRCTLHRGSFSIEKASIKYDPTEEVVVFDIPLSLKSFWFNVEKDLYALFSGDLLFRRTSALNSFLSGELIVEHAHVSESLLKLPVMQKARPQSILDETQAYPLGLDVKVRSVNPVVVTLARLEGAAHIRMHIGNTLSEPILSGVVYLDEGKVVFPYKPLIIRKAQLTFLPQQSYDPTIELLAKNRIKGYDVSLAIQGTVSSHDISMQSTPSLSDEQLVGLLYAGSEQSALGALVPSMVMRNITSVFSRKGSDSRSDKDTWLKRLKRIHLVPSFTDQRGRGGVRGTLEVDINDHWRALMQKNFSLSEDTRFEIDYDLSDDVSLRALRDERRDLGAEVEVKVKF